MTNNPLGEKSASPARYDASVLYPIPRWPARSLLDIDKKLLMYGIDHWHAYELSWLNVSGIPQVAIAEFYFNSNSENIVESKSLKLYLNSLYAEQYTSASKVAEIITRDLSAVSKSEVKVTLHSLDEAHFQSMVRAGRSIDGSAPAVFSDQPDENLLQVLAHTVDDEQLYSDLFRSNCPVTGQPDWASFEIRYSGHKIDEASLLAYLCSYRNHQGYHEECAERIYRDITLQCAPSELRIGLNFLRRGGLDINVYRSTVPVTSDSVNNRLVRQ